jgi:hypothetical protein
MILINRGVPLLLVDNVAVGVGVTSSVFALPSGAGTIVWQTFFGTAPGSTTIDLEFSLDNVHWDPVDSTTVVAGEVRTFSTVGGRFVRAKMSAVAGGTTFSVEILCQRI